jgi:hypothetical protein
MMILTLSPIGRQRQDRLFRVDSSSNSVGAEGGNRTARRLSDPGFQGRVAPRTSSMK